MPRLDGTINLQVNDKLNSDRLYALPHITLSGDCFATRSILLQNDRKE